MSDLNRPYRSTLASTQQVASRFSGNRYASAIATPEPGSYLSNKTSYSTAGQARPSHMESYSKLVDAIVRFLMKEGFTFIEAYDQVLLVGKLNPLTTANQMRLNNPCVDREAFLEFKAYNASTRLKRRYSKVLNQYFSVMGNGEKGKDRVL